MLTDATRELSVLRVRHASELPISVRVAAYCGVLLGYIFYCYNFVVVDYVRPFLISNIGFTVSGTALISIAGNIGVTVGAVVWAGFIARVGLRRAVAITAAGIGMMAAIQASTHLLGVWVGGRFFMAALLGGYYVVATSLVVALFPETSRAKLVALNSAMYPAANIAVGVLGGWLGETGWYALLWLAAAPLPIAILIWFVVPDETRYRPYDDNLDPQAASEPGSWREMLSPGLKWITIGCILLAGLDFNAYQLFQGFITLYIHNELHLSTVAMGAIVATISTGSFIGNFLWAAIADRWGRRPPLVGYLVAAVMVMVFLLPGLDQVQLSIVGFVFGLGMSCTSAWGAWFAELFPSHLRTHGAALFHAGHIMALGAPLFAAYASQSLGMTTSMRLAAGVYVLAAILWFVLPETLSRAKTDRDKHHVPEGA